MNEHQHALQELNADKASLFTRPNLIVHPRTFYIIYGTNDSGITHLCKALGNTGVAGKPAQYFTSPHDLHYAEQWGISLRNDPSDHFDEAYIQSAFAAGTTSNGIFGVKAVWPDVPYCLEPSLANMFSPFQYIMIMRRDKLRQAIAWWQDLEQWQNGNGKELREQPAFDFRTIEYLRQTITNYERCMLKFFSIKNIQPFIVVHEDLVTAYEEKMSQILAYLDVPVPKDLLSGEQIVQKQADEQIEEWVRKYHQISDEQEKVYTDWSMNVHSTISRV